MSRLIDMADRIIIPGSGGNGVSDAELSPLQVFDKEIQEAVNKVCRSNVPVAFVMGILHSVATEIKFNLQMSLIQEQAAQVARAMEEAAKLKPQ